MTSLQSITNRGIFLRCIQNNNDRRCQQTSLFYFFGGNFSDAKFLNFNIKIICVLDKNKIIIRIIITKIQMGSSNLFADFSSYQSVLLAAVIHISAGNCI